MVAATVSATSAAPIGKPPPSALATDTRSGVRPSDGNANISPVRPMPHWISSAMSSAPVRCARLLDRLGQRRRHRPHAAFALDRLDDDRRRLAGDQPIERRRIVGRRERDAGQQRLERVAVVLVPGHRQRAERAPGERVIEGDELGARLAARVPVAARELQAGLVGLAAAVAEEGAAQARRACVRRSASWPCSGWKNRFDVCASSRACAPMASAMRALPLPSAATPMPDSRSR